MYNPISGNTNEFLELRNAGTNDVNIGGWSFSDGITYTFQQPTVLGPDAYLVVAVNRTAFSALYPSVTNLAPGVYGGQLSNQGETVALSDAASQVVFSVTYDNTAPWPLAAAGLGSSLVLIDPQGTANDPANWAASAQLNGSPGGPDQFFVRDVVINEVLAHTDPPLEDAVELSNLTTNAISVAGWYLSDDNAVRKKYRFPEGSVIQPLGYLTVYEYQMTNSPVPFSLSSKGDAIYLSEADGADQLIRYVDQHAFEASQNGVSFGRHPDGTGDFLTLTTPTFGVNNPESVQAFRTGTGARNSGPKVGPVVINEIMYHPSDSNALGRMPAEYVELLNISADPVFLYNAETPTNTWSLTGGISYSFPTNLALQPGQFLLVTATNDLAGFRASYGISTNVQILGPWTKALNNAGDTVRLRAPNNLELPDNTVARFVVDEVTYKDQLPWPLAADGLGGSLERTDPNAFGNTPLNWHSAPDTATPGATNTHYIPPGSVVISEVMAFNRSTLRDEDGEFSDWIELFNTTALTISLKGWHLTDQADAPTLWTFPDVSIPAHGQLLVFASKKNKTDPLAPLHTNFALDAGGEYLALFRDDLTLEFAFDPAFPAQEADVSYGYDQLGARTATPVAFGTAGRYLVPTNVSMLASDWNTRAFDDSAWKPAGNGIGYDRESTFDSLFQTDLEAEMYGSGKPKSAFVRYPFVIQDSASVEQILLRLKFDDGVAAWLNGTLVASNNAPSPLLWNSGAYSDRSDNQALVFKDFNLNAFAHLLVDGTNVLAMQVLNSAATSSDLLLMSELQLIWAASTNTATRPIGFFEVATPGNANSAALPGAVTSPTFSPPGGVFSGTLAVTVSCANAEAAIYYTLDGSAPTTNSPLYSAALTITSNTEILARAFVPGLVPSPVTGAVYRRSFLGINEILPNNVAATPEIADFTDYGDWIELYNGGTSAVDLSGYYLSDNIDQPFRWRIPDGATIPAGGHLLFWADGFDSKPGLTLTRNYWPNESFVTRFYHTNFKLSADGEAAGLFTPSGTRIDAVTYGPDTSSHLYWEKVTDWQQGDISYGRYPDGGTNWGYFGESTAGTTNRPPQLAHNLYRAPAVTISPAEPLFVDGPVTVTLSSDPGVSAIRYTLDSSQPSSASHLYTNAFTVATTTVVRARAFAEGLHPGVVATRTFLVNQRKPDLPVVSLVIDPLVLFDDVYGIFKNSLKEREVPGSIQFATTPTNSAFQFDAGFRLFSYNTYLGAQKPFTVYLDGKYGTDEIGYQLFPEKPIGHFDRFVLRNGCDDWAYAFFRDPLCSKILEGQILCGLQAYRPTSSYLNGAYYGLLNIREKLDEMYVFKNESIPLENIDFYEMDGLGPTAVPLLDCGTETGWLSLNDFVAKHDLSVATNYEYVCTQVDVENLMDFVIADTFVANVSWFHNRKWWRDRTPAGRWRWGFFDLDQALLGDNVNNATLADFMSRMEIFRELLDNPDFRATFAQRYAAHINSTFSPDRVLPIIDREASRIRREMASHVSLYASKGGIPSTNAWENEVEEIRNFMRVRPSVMFQQLSALFAQSNDTAQVVLAVETGTGQVRANYVPLTEGVTNTLLSGLPVRLTATPAIGQAFAYWIVSRSPEGVQTNANAVLEFTPESGETATVQAVFYPTEETLLPAVISGRLDLTAAGSPYLACGDIYVPSNATLTAGPGVTIQMPDAASIYVQGELRLTGTPEDPVCILPNTNANARADTLADPALTAPSELTPAWGGIAFDRADHEGVLSNVVIRGATFAAADPVNMIAAVSASRTSLSLFGLDVDESLLPVISWDAERLVLDACRLHITVIGDALKVTRVAHTRIERCDMFCGLEIIDTDAMDLGEILGDCIVRFNHIHDFAGPNNDGLDIGEHCAGILVESNLIERCYDKGVSVGSGSTVTVRRNVIRNVAKGIGVKDLGSFALSENNTFYDVTHAVAAYEKVNGRGGASAVVSNNIVSHASASPFYFDSLSSVDVRYTLSDTDAVPGTGNAVGDPLFLNPDGGNFNLQTGSPAIDTGAPDSAPDPDGSPADMGASPFDWREGHAVISEIHYHPAAPELPEFIELTNPGGAPLDLSGHRFSKGLTYEFSSGTTLNPGSFLVIASAAGITNALVWTAGVLDNAGEAIELSDADSNVIDRVDYKPSAPWPAEPDGLGPSLSLLHPRWNNALPTSWCASAETNGTAGAPFDNPEFSFTNRLVVISAYNGTIPQTGTNWLAHSDLLVSCVTNSPITSGTTQFVCTGWVSSGGIYASGQTTNTPALRLEADTTLVWQWNTNFWLHTTTNGCGSLSVDNGWQPSGSALDVFAAAAIGWRFSAWSGDTNGCSISSNLITVTMNQPKQIEARFDPLFATNNVPLWWLAHYNLTNYNEDAMQDADEDGFATWQEWIAGTDPTNPVSRFAIDDITSGEPNKRILRWTSAGNRFYAVSRSTNLLLGADGFPPLSAATNLPATPPVNLYTDTVEGAGIFFYQLQVWQ